MSVEKVHAEFNAKREDMREAHKEKSARLQARVDAVAASFAERATKQNEEADKLHAAGLSPTTLVAKLYALHDKALGETKVSIFENAAAADELAAAEDAAKAEAEALAFEFNTAFDSAKLDDDAAAQMAAMVEPEPDTALAASDAASQSIYDTLTKLGVKPEDLAAALGIEPASEREKRRKNEKDERDRMRKDWEAGQAFDKAEREKVVSRVLPTARVLPTDPAAGWSATWEKKSATTLELVITNASGVKAIAYRETSSNGKQLTTGSRTVGTTAPAVDTYSYSKGWPFATLNVTLRIGHPVTGALIPATRKGQQ
jgi:hypothetical protein